MNRKTNLGYYKNCLVATLLEKKQQLEKHKIEVDSPKKGH